MSNPTSITSISNSLLLQSQSQQTQRIADQASQTARSLRAQAKEARTEAERAQATAFSLELKASEAQATANRASLNLQTAATISDMQTNVENFYASLPKTIAFHSEANTPAPPATTESPASTTPTVGTVIDTTA